MTTIRLKSDRRPTGLSRISVRNAMERLFGPAPLKQTPKKATPKKKAAKKKVARKK